ncbi:PD-(D/E)XK nuclease family protein [Leeuwenhoekiella sp. NPDC079379]|uniref:PD-(D/E)XK nuclease family protein n=1 Tax=Leeuwenhoekiella sp. NPDC079379 TaxID=3364122 RepID=UPI0037C7F9BF
MEVALSTYKKLLSETSRIISHQKDLAQLRGENFNVFSILKMESRENETHSAFLGELLNPNGSHGLGTLFLELFLKQLDVSHLEVDSTTVKLEHYIGGVKIKDVSGGRIDIFIEDAAGNSICIENKIYASDQEVQIARYCNYNTYKNKVYYLTLEGDAPSEDSSIDKRIDIDFYALSYKSEILEWLEQCQKEATRLPILRESINQYGILIKKLTNQLSDSKMEKEVENIIIANYQAASVIGDNIWKVELKYAEKLIDEICQALTDSLSDDFKIFEREDLKIAWTGIYISHKNWPEHVYVKLEGNSKIPWSTSIYGIMASKDKFNRESVKSLLVDVELFKSGFKESKVWPYYKEILSLGTSEDRLKLFNDPERAGLVKGLSDKLEELALLCEEPFSRLESTN